MKETKVYDEKTLLKKVKEHYKNYNYDFSNFYFTRNIWKKDYIGYFGELPTNIPSNVRKIKVYINAISGDVINELPMNGIVIQEIKQSYKRNYFYKIEYIKELNCIAIESWYVMAGVQCIYKNEFFYIDEKKNLIVAEDLGDTSIVNPKYYNKTIEEICGGSSLCRDVDKMFYKAFQPLFPIAFFGGNNYMFIRNEWQLSAFLSQKEVVRRSGPKQNKIDELCAMDLPKPENIRFDISNNSNGWWSKSNITVIADRVNEEYAVLRWFKKDEENRKIYETSRLFVSKKDVFFCRINSFGEFVYINGKMSARHFKAQEYINTSKDVFNGTKLEYFQQCVDELEKDCDKVTLMWLFSYYPIAEKMWKIKEYKFIPYDFVTTGYGYSNFDNHLENYFGQVNVNAKNINRAIGVNAYQATKLLSYLSDEENKNRHQMKNTFRYIKRGTGLSDLSSIDNDSYDAMCDMIELLNNIGSYYTSEIISLLYNSYSLKTLVRVSNDLKQIDSLDRNTMAMYRDYLSMASKINETSNFRPYFKTKEDIRQMHDAILAIYELKRDAIKVEAFGKRSSRWKKWEYNKNNTFVVVAPIKPSDLAKEGITLHHCVRSYIDRVADGRTNIMFIRKADNLDEPFFTVEVSNNGTIEQVHGFANCNANTNPDLVKFLSEWAKACKLQTHNYNKIR